MGQLRTANSRAKAPRSPKWSRKPSHWQSYATTRKQVALQTIELVNPVELLNISDLETHRTLPNDMHSKPNNGCWALSGISNGTKAKALSSKSTRLYLGHLNNVEQC